MRMHDELAPRYFQHTAASLLLYTLRIGRVRCTSRDGCMHDMDIRNPALNLYSSNARDSLRCVLTEK